MPERNDSNQAAPLQVRVLGPDDEIVGRSDVRHDRFMVRAEDSGGGFTLVEHLIPPGVLAAPLHRHTQEDKYSYVLEGTRPIMDRHGLSM